MGGNNRLMEFEVAMNSENKGFSLLMGPPETILGTFPAEIVYKGSPLCPPEVARHRGRGKHGACCPGSNSCLQNNNLLSVHQAQSRLSKLPLMRGLLTLTALVSDSWHCWGRECGESHTLPCWERQGPWRLHKSSDGLDNGSSPTSERGACTAWQTCQIFRNLGIAFSSSLVSAPLPQLQKNKTKKTH